MNKILVLLITMLISTQVLAEKGAKVLLLKGTATFGGFPLKNTSKMTGKGTITVGDKSYLKILLLESNTVIALAANSTSDIHFSAPAEEQQLDLTKGIARWVTGSKKGKGIKTPNAILGVRGTDFYVSYFPEKGETELMCFSGTVEMINASNPDDSKKVTDSQWGGIGGSYGKGVTDIKTLTPEVISIFDKAIPK
jgi:hypothetical protein